jgi:hypothetical protein
VACPLLHNLGSQLHMLHACVAVGAARKAVLRNGMGILHKSMGKDAVAGDSPSPYLVGLLGQGWAPKQPSVLLAGGSALP